ncbi:polysaccharide biosynthesis tyrosine autokinase [Rhizobiaceae bacterium BDR2-2]|uniref:non-specific protein-tyrosine kinase n=1 Tax=Ectorhizobium quercum TaxID=2965071 RepID=A0AAE3N0C3_9HYPH|nr:polysaccharide biosynthesis tyrosine autokinase [Ectorhizobium quercum]MCX8998428.1 polysaccharide biosynthesis tyrosine autokinase [Ectorhizobium quercum]
MNNREVGESRPVYDDGFAKSEFVDLEALLAVVYRQWRVVAVCVVAAILVGLGFLLTSVPRYQATASLLIDRANTEVVQQLTPVGPTGEDEGNVLSQLEILTSQTIALAVVDKLNLLENPVFNANDSSLVSTVIGTVRSLVNVGAWFSSGDDAEDSLAVDDRRQQAAAQLLKNLSVSRVGRTYVLAVSYESTSPQFSADVANAIASEYLVDKLNSKYEATRRASDWLVDRIAELRQRALETDFAVQKFRADNGLIQTGTSGNLISDQQLSELNSALIVAQSDTARARARLVRIEQILQSDDSEAIVTDILDNTVANELRKKFLEASKSEAEISARFGSDHAQAVKLRGEMQEYRRLMFEEVSRIAQSYKSDLEVAEARERSLRESVGQASNVSTTAGATQVQLRELQREADTYRNLYQTFLQRYQEAVQQQSFPVTDARILSNATPPERPSKPKKPLILAIFAVLGAAAGGGLGAFREFRDRFFRTGDQVRGVLGLEFLGNAPIIENTPNLGKAADTAPGKRSIVKLNSGSNYVVDHPLSSFAETLRSTRLAIDFGIQGKNSRIIGVVSALPGEGKSTISINLAELLASQGARTVLIDADIRNPGATRAIGRHAEAGLLEVLLESRDYQNLLLYNDRTGLAFLPTIVKQRIPHSSEVLMSVAMRKLLGELSGNFDYIIIDLPPLGPVIDARAMASFIDGFVFVAEWGKTARRAVRQTLDSEPLIKAKSLGVILNKVDQKKLNLYKTYGSSEYYYSRYSQYYQDGK